MSQYGGFALSRPTQSAVPNQASTPGNAMLQRAQQLRAMGLESASNNGRPNPVRQNTGIPSWAVGNGGVGSTFHMNPQQQQNQANMWQQNQADLQNRASFMPSYNQPNGAAPYSPNNAKPVQQNPYMNGNNLSPRGGQLPGMNQLKQQRPEGMDPRMPSEGWGNAGNRGQQVLQQMSNVAPVQTAQTVGGYWGGNESQQFMPQNSFGSWWM